MTLSEKQKNEESERQTMLYRLRERVYHLF
jgi:hypothetical protein